MERSVPQAISAGVYNHLLFIDIDTFREKTHVLRTYPLMVYALALSRRTGLRLYDFTCAWFDEHNYFEFYPLHVVHKRGSLQSSRYR